MFIYISIVESVTENIIKYWNQTLANCLRGKFTNIRNCFQMGSNKYIASLLLQFDHVNYLRLNTVETAWYI